MGRYHPPDKKDHAQHSETKTASFLPLVSVNSQTGIDVGYLLLIANLAKATTASILVVILHCDSVATDREANRLYSDLWLDCRDKLFLSCLPGFGIVKLFE